MNTILRGIILGLSITAPIGPTNIEIIHRGLKSGWRSAASFCLGVILALLLYLFLVTFGLSFLTESVIFNTLLSIFGVLMLAYLAYNALHDFFTKKEIDMGDDTHGEQHFFPGIVLTIANPAVLLLWTGILGADLASNRVSLEQGLSLSLGILIGVTLFFTILILLIHFARNLLRKEFLKYMSLIAGLILLYFCITFGRNIIMQWFG